MAQLYSLALFKTLDVYYMTTVLRSRRSECTIIILAVERRLKENQAPMAPSSELAPRAPSTATARKSIYKYFLSITPRLTL